MIEVIGLHYRIPSTEVYLFGSLGFSVEKGETVILLANSPNVTTALLQLLAGIASPDAGTITVGGESLQEMKRQRLRAFQRKIGVISDVLPLLDDRNVWLNVVLPLELDDVLDGTSRHRAEKLLRNLGVAEVRDRYPSSLTASERMKVRIARALVREPLLLLADDPTAGLTDEHAEQIAGMLNQQSLRGMTTVIATCDPRLPAKMLVAARTIVVVHETSFAVPAL